MKKIYFIILLSLLSWINISYALCIPKRNALSLDEKIGQLIMVAAVSVPERNQKFMKKSPYSLDPNMTERIICQYHVGGVIFLGAGTPQAQAEVTEKLQKLSKYPLLIGLDAEWGLSMRHQENVIPFPRAMVLGALTSGDDNLIYELGNEIGCQCRELGVHINFAPVADVNNNPRNPIINTRSFGENPEKVSRKATLFMQGMQSSGILACAKHFPGHGDTETDSHHARGIIAHPQKRLHDVELKPFKQLINDNVDAIMTAHLDVPALSKGQSVPATLSHDIITSLLRDQLKFEGLVITDGLGMKGVTNDFEPGELELRALKAGNDILLCPVDVPRTIARIKQAILEGDLTEDEIDLHVERILRAKRKVIMQQRRSFDKTRLLTPMAKSLKKRLYQAAVTLVRDRENMLPFNEVKKIIISFGESGELIRRLKKQKEVEHINAKLNATAAELDALNVDDYDQLIVSLHLEGRSGMIEMQSTKAVSIPPAYIGFIKKYAKKIALILFGNPYNLEHFSHIATILVGYENEPEAQQAVAEILLGLRSARGILPVTPSCF